MTPSIFAQRPAASQAYSRLVMLLDSIGPYRVEEKKTSLHLVAGKSAFLGVHPRKDGIRLNIVLDRELSDPSVVKVEKVSAKRWHNELDLPSDGELSPELCGWIREAHLLQTR
jgi:hypothetical protein